MNKKGFTLVEMLIAIALLSLILALVSGGVVTAMKANRVHDAASASQTRARRVLEIVSQDLRSAALGSITNTPYVSSNNAISFPRLAGGAGYDAPFRNRDTSATFIRSTTDTSNRDWTGDLGSVLVVDVADGDAFVSRVTGTGWRDWGGRIGRLLGVGHGRCGNAVGALGAGLTGTAQTNRTLFRVNSVGYSFDANQNRLLRQIEGNQTVVAFDIENFAVSYIYRDKVTGDLDERATPINSNGAALIENNNWKLAQLQINLDVAEPSSGRDNGGDLRTVTRTYTSYVDLADSSSSFQIGRVGTC